MNNPVIGVVMCRNRLKGQGRPRLCKKKYLNAIIHAGGLPIALPHALAEPSLLEQLRCRNSMAFIFLVVPATCSRTYMVKTAMSLTPIPGVIF
ncbi:hypothetical protein MJK71_10710 [Escherichia coli]|nr:hypothetical protein MJK71_10710 [Escherichia coli]